MDLLAALAVVVTLHQELVAREHQDRVMLAALEAQAHQATAQAAVAVLVLLGKLPQALLLLVTAALVLHLLFQALL